MRTEIKHLAPYLPYELLCTANDNCFVEHPLEGLHHQNDIAIFDFEDGEQEFRLSDFKPMLFPMDVLMDRQVAILYFENDSELLGEDWSPYAKAKRFVETGQTDILNICEPYTFWERLFKDHFDVFGLIDAGLALPK